jgi:ribokinase
MSPKITVIGSANIDYIMQMPHLPKLGETVNDAKFFQAYGGKGANQAVAAARAGAVVSFVAALGNDLTAQSYKQSLEGHGIDCSRVSLESKFPSGSALVMFDSQGDNYISVASGSNACVSPERVQDAESLIMASDWIILQQEIPQVTNQAVLAIAAKHQRPVLLNYAPANDLSLQLDAAVHGLVVNEIEAAELLGESFQPDDSSAATVVARQLQERGNHRFVAVTLGANGLALADAETCTHIPVFQVDAVDATAAGDTFCGALALALGEGKPLLDAARFASAASALAVTKVGAQTSIPSRCEIDSFLRDLNG